MGSLSKRKLVVMTNRFAMTGAAGYVAPRHMKAIYETGNSLVAVLDPHDSVGILDSYFPRSRYFSEPERFDRHLEKLRRKGHSQKIDWMSVCSPNYLHDAHIRIALRVGADVICEKPLVLNPWNLDAIRELESETGKKVYSLLQLRHHPSILQLKKDSAMSSRKNKAEICITYIAPRGAWYLNSWKGNMERSGGLVSNIGVHFFDMLIWIYGSVLHSEVHLAERMRSSGFLELERANVRWFLSIAEDDLLLADSDVSGTYRSIAIDGKEIDFSSGFADLHTVAYRSIFAGRGTTTEEARPTIQLLHDIRNSTPDPFYRNKHEFLRKKEFLNEIQSS